MPATLNDSIVIAASPRAVFSDLEMPDLALEDRNFTLPPAVNGATRMRRVADWTHDMLARNNGVSGKMTGKPVEVVLLSGQSPDSLQHSSARLRETGMPIERVLFTNSRCPSRQLHPLTARLYVSTDRDNVQAALRDGHRAVQAVPRTQSFEPDAEPAKPHAPPPATGLPITIAMSPTLLFADADAPPLPDDDFALPPPCTPPAAQDRATNAAGLGLRLARKLAALNEGGDKLHLALVSAGPEDEAALQAQAMAHDLPVQTVMSVAGTPPHDALAALAPALYLSSDRDRVRDALRRNIPAAHIGPHAAQPDPDPHALHVTFDFDGVAGSDEAERVFAQGGLDAFQRHETDMADTPLPKGPLYPTLAGLSAIRATQTADSVMKLNIGLCTSRSVPGEMRAQNTLRQWGIVIDDAAFLGGLPKGPFLQAIAPDIFFDDQKAHIEDAAAYVLAGHVPMGIRNADFAAEDQQAAHAALFTE